LGGIVEIDIGVFLRAWVSMDMRDYIWKKYVWEDVCTWLSMSRRVAGGIPNGV
jgi:hypothetical protein